MTIKEAFNQVCADALPAQSQYVSLYALVPYYGGPEEGGWYGSDVELVAYRECRSEVEAQALLEKVTVLADELSQQAKREFGEYCRRSLDEAEAKGLFAEDLPEVDGEVSYFVVTETFPGSQSREGNRVYE